MVGEELPLGRLEPGEDGDKLPLELAVRVADDGHAELRDLLLAGKLQEHLPLAAAQPALRDTKLPADGDNYGIQRNTGTALVGGDGALLYADSRSEICLVEFERFAQKFYAFVHTYLLRVQYSTSNIALQY